MALSIIDGSNANIDISINSNSYKAHFGYWTASLSRDFLEATTFASGGWRARIPGMRQLTFSCAGYVTKSDAMSDPSLTFTSQASVPIVLTADTNCTFTFSGWVGRSTASLRAAAMSDFALEGESTGAVTTAWVVT